MRGFHWKVHPLMECGYVEVQSSTWFLLLLRKPSACWANETSRDMAPFSAILVPSQVFFGVEEQMRSSQENKEEDEQVQNHTPAQILCAGALSSWNKTPFVSFTGHLQVSTLNSIDGLALQKGPKKPRDHHHIPCTSLEQVCFHWLDHLFVSVWKGSIQHPSWLWKHSRNQQDQSQCQVFSLDVISLVWYPPSRNLCHAKVHLAEYSQLPHGIC